MKKLGEFIKSRMNALRMTDRDVADLSKGHLTYGAVNQLTNCKNKDVRLASLYGIALGIGVSVEILLAIALDINPLERNLLTSQEQELITHFRRLPVETQAFILQTAKTFCTQKSPAIDGIPAVIASHGPIIASATSPTKKGGKK